MPPVKAKAKPKLVNRGPAGLLSKGPAAVAEGAAFSRPKSHNKIVPSLRPLAVDIASLAPDPDNARLHPEKNLEAIKDSLALFGQRKPVVVRKQGMVVVAGNGTLEAAKQLGWTKIAASVEPMTDVEAAGYGLADNRTAELARWDFEVVARLEGLISAKGVPMTGWSPEELAALRGAEAPDAFPEVGEDIEVKHVCPKCGYRFSGGETVEEPKG